MAYRTFQVKEPGKLKFLRHGKSISMMMEDFQTLLEKLKAVHLYISMLEQESNLLC